jgi:hypothetical protein
MLEVTNLKYVQLNELEKDNIAFNVIQGLKRPYFVAEHGYLDSEKEFGSKTEDPYIAMEFDPTDPEHVALVSRSSTRRCIEILDKVAEGLPLESDQSKFLNEGYNFIGETGDFLIESLYPLAVYIYAKESLHSNEYMTDYGDSSEILKLLIFKFLTRYHMVYEDFEASDFGLHEKLGISREGFSFKQLAVMLGFDTERTARGLALDSTPVEKRISVFKSSGNRTFIKKEIFVEYVNNYNKTRTIERKENAMSVEIKLTGGNIRNNHVYLTKVMDMFPNQYVGGSKKSECANALLTLDVGNGKVFKTDIAGDKKIFRTREALKAFFENYDVNEGDFVVLNTTKTGYYTLRPKN